MFGLLLLYPLLNAVGCFIGVLSVALQLQQRALLCDWPFWYLAHVVCECLMECVILETIVVICCQRRLGLMLLSGWDGFYDTGVSGIGQSRSFHGLQRFVCKLLSFRFSCHLLRVALYLGPPFPLAFEGIVPVQAFYGMFFPRELFWSQFQFCSCSYHWP